MDIQTLLTGTGSFGVMLGAMLTFLRSARGRRAVAAFFDESFGLNDKIDAAVDIAVAILQDSLDARGEELAKLQAEIDNLQEQITELKTSDTAKSSRIAELEAEVIALRAENEVLREELKRRRGGRPRKDATPPAEEA
jgi:peptidoglycan hydrolase CwlO-like protein